MPFLNPKLGIDFTDYIADHTTNFIGRKWVFDAIQSWLTDPKGDRFFLVTGEPGSGKTAIAARLTQFAQGTEICLELAGGFLQAVHFCSARDSVWTDPKEFARSLALQLAQSIPEFGLALKDIGEKTNNISVDLTVGTVQNSDIKGVVIQNLTLSGFTGQEAFTQVVVNPLRQIQQEGFSQPVTILVDSLDEALTHDGESTIVSLLSKLSANVKLRLILTSRNEGRVKEKIREYEELFLSASENLDKNQQDIKAYINAKFRQEKTLQNCLQADTLDQEILTTNLIEKSEGNFLYVRFLLESVTLGQQNFTNLDGLPQGLDELYYISLARVVELGKKDWSEVYAPVMGVLLAAQESLTESQIRAFTKLKESVVWSCLNDLQQFLDEIESEDEETLYKLYHQSVTDFLSKRQLVIRKKKLNNRYYLSGQEQHQRLLEYYRPEDKTWNKVQLEKIDHYGLRHLAHHLKQVGQKEQLYTLLIGSSSWMNAKFAAFANDEAYVADLELALGNFVEPFLPHEIVILAQIYTARQVIYHRASRNNDGDLKTLVWLGGEAEAIHLALSRSDDAQRFSGLLTIHSTLQEKGQPPNSALLREMWESAQSMEHWKRTSALRELATVLGQIGHRSEVNEIFTEAVESIKTKTEQAIEEAVTLTAESVLSTKKGNEQIEGLQELAFVLIQLRQFVEAKRVIQKLGDSCPEDNLWKKRYLISLRGHLSIALAQAGQFDEAERVARTINDSETQANTLKHLAINLAQAEQFAQAGRIIQNIVSPAIQTQALRHLAVAFAQAGQQVIAIATFTEARKMARVIEDDATRSETLSELAIALLQSCQQFDAIQTFAEAKEIALSIRDSQKQAEALGQLAIALASAKYFPEAEEVARTIKDYWRQADILRQMGTILMQAGQESQAFATFTNAREINRVAETNHERPKALRHVALAFAQTGQLIDAEQTAQVIESSESRALVLKEIAVMLMQTGHQDEAMKFIQNAKEAAYAGKSGTALRALASALVLLKEFTEAEQVAQAIDFDASRMAALGEIVTALAKLGQFTEAERLVQSMETGGHQVIALRELASAKQSTQVEQEVQSIDSGKSLAPDISQIADALAPSERQVEASAMLAEAEQLARLLDSSERGAETLKKLKGILIHLAHSGHVVEAERLACSIENSEIRIETLCMLVIALDKAGVHYAKTQKILNVAQENSQTIKSEEKRSKALTQLATAMTLTMNFKSAFNTVGLLEINTFLSVLSEWAPAFEKVEAGLLAKVLKEVIRILGWVHPDWQKLSQSFDATTF